MVGVNDAINNAEELALLGHRWMGGLCFQEGEVSTVKLFQLHSCSVDKGMICVRMTCKSYIYIIYFIYIYICLCLHKTWMNYECAENIRYNARMQRTYSMCLMMFSLHMLHGIFLIVHLVAAFAAFQCRSPVCIMNLPWCPMSILWYPKTSHICSLFTSEAAY